MLHMKEMRLRRSYGRYPDGTGAFATHKRDKKDRRMNGNAPSVVINEVESNGDSTDW